MENKNILRSMYITIQIQTTFIKQEISELSLMLNISIIQVMIGKKGANIMQRKNKVITI